MCHSCWLTPLVRLKWYFWEWFTGPAEKSGAKPFHWELLTLGSNAGGSQFQHGMDFSSFLSDKWSAYVRWEIEKNEKAAGLGGSIWKLHMQAEGTGKVLQFLLPSGVMGALGEAWSVWKRCSTKAPPCSPVWVWATEPCVQHQRVCWYQPHLFHHLVINCSHTFMVGTLHLLSFCLVFILCITNRIWVWVGAQQTLCSEASLYARLLPLAPAGTIFQVIYLLSMTNIWWFLLSSIICSSPNSVIFSNYCSIWSN